MSELIFRKATIDDIPDLVDLRKRQLQDEGQKPDTDMDQSLSRYFHEKMTAGQLVEYLAEADGTAIASAAVIFMDYPPSFADPDGTMAYVANVYTADDFRGRGIAGILLEKVEQEARARGKTRLLLHASKMGIKAYRKAGYKETDTVMEKDI
ncbi:MAG: GNAT family N-acetyltransferase [Oscillospiraceae bacterium]|nr:GNAT family N-acetyltransferase [Oscillospiraceae bacterium]